MFTNSNYSNVVGAFVPYPITVTAVSSPPNGGIIAASVTLGNISQNNTNSVTIATKYGEIITVTAIPN